MFLFCLLSVQDQGLDALAAVISRQKIMGQEIGNELDEQNGKVECSCVSVHIHQKYSRHITHLSEKLVGHTCSAMERLSSSNLLDTTQSAVSRHTHTHSLKPQWSWLLP